MYVRCAPPELIVSVVSPGASAVLLPSHPGDAAATAAPWRESVERFGSDEPPPPSHAPTSPNTTRIPTARRTATAGECTSCRGARLLHLGSRMRVSATRAIVRSRIDQAGRPLPGV